MVSLFPQMTDAEKKSSSATRARPCGAAPSPTLGSPTRAAACQSRGCATARLTATMAATKTMATAGLSPSARQVAAEELISLTPGFGETG